jgi:pyruvate,orthophosphate dikinase
LTKNAAACLLRRNMQRKQIFRFGKGVGEGAELAPDMLGAKAHGLAVMAALDLPVPPGFTIAPEAQLSREQLSAAIKKVGKGFGEPKEPLLLAMRQSPLALTLGANTSVLNIGLNDDTVAGLARQVNNEAAALAAYRQLVETYGVLVMGMRHSQFEEAGAGSREEVETAKARVLQVTGKPFPQDGMDQFEGFFSALRGKKLAVVVQQVALTEAAPITITTRNPVTASPYASDGSKLGKQIAAALQKIERAMKRIQQVTYSVVDGEALLIKTLPAKLSAKAELKMLVDFVGEGVMSREEALLAVEPLMLDHFLHPTLDPAIGQAVFASGIAASPGAVSGELVLTAADAHQAKARGVAVILVRHETSPEDIQGMHAAEGVLTVRGGLLSHAAVIARGMGKPCVVGATTLRIDEQAGTMSSLGQVIQAGETITIDGATGRIYRGAVPTLKPEISGDFGTILEWADKARRMRVRANAETPADARAARYFGAEGIGLCRTEHMFFSPERIGPMRRMILAETPEARAAALAEILPLQKQDFVELFEIMAGLPVTIRLLDPPLHEFLPKSEHEIEAVAAEMGIKTEYLRTRVTELQEFNPMLGHRGVRLAVSYPEIVVMQARAIFEAIVEVARKYGKAPIPEIMIPLVFGRPELALVKQAIIAVAAEVEEESGFSLTYLIGTMIELPRAALRAAEIAQSAEFFSFGTNDLTQTTLGISRDDSARFIGEYTTKGLLAIDPFISLDVEGVGELLKLASERGRKARPSLKLGICGEHAGDPASIDFCEGIRLDYVSCSPFRIAVARLAAAQATIRNK